MATVKEHLRTLIKRLPNDCTIEDAIYELYVIDRIECGLEALDRGEVVSQEQVEEEFKECLNTRSPGRRRRCRISGVSTRTSARIRRRTPVA
ncbi:MAG: hypothetical protein NTW87_03610 [Planctomycetota bacterium]|nr:hypothetical protein [Planctomycetota bacterium]